MRYIDGLLYLGLLSLVGFFITAWLFALIKPSGRRWQRPAFLGGFTLLILTSVLWVGFIGHPALIVSGKSFQIKNFQLDTEIVDPITHFQAMDHQIQTYFIQIEKNISAILPDKFDLAANPWQQDMDRQKERGDAVYHISFWQEESQTITRIIACNIRPYGQISYAAIPPIMTFEFPESGLQLDWYVNTGSYDLDMAILKTIKAITDSQPWQ